MSTFSSKFAAVSNTLPAPAVTERNEAIFVDITGFDLRTNRLRENVEHHIRIRVIDRDGKQIGVPISTKKAWEDKDIAQAKEARRLVEKACFEMQRKGDFDPAMLPGGANAWTQAPQRTTVDAASGEGIDPNSFF